MSPRLSFLRHTSIPIGYHFIYGNVNCHVTLYIHLTLSSPLPMSTSVLYIGFSIAALQINSSVHLLDFRYMHSVQFSSVAQSCPTISDPMDCSTAGFPVYCQLPEFTQTHIPWLSDAIQPSHPLSSLSPAFNLPQQQGLFKWVSFSHQVAKVLEFQLQHQSFQWVFKTDFL